jgi:hypothetical protein
MNKGVCNLIQKIEEAKKMKSDRNGNGNGRAKDEAEIARIAIIYARAVDTLGNEGDKEIAMAYFRQGFTEDCLFEYYWPDGTSFGKTHGISEFTEFCYGFMQDKYRNTHHAMSNTMIENLENDTAEMHSYVIARHMRADNSQDIAIAYYRDEITREDGKWKCRERKCHILGFDNFAPQFSLY